MAKLATTDVLNELREIDKPTIADVVATSRRQGGIKPSCYGRQIQAAWLASANVAKMLGARQ
jgi:hypothetical protein